MYTSVVVVALSGFLAHGVLVPQSATWYENHGAAYKQGLSLKRPLAVFIGSGQSGWDKLSKDGKIGKNVQAILDSEYVCMYIDTSKPAGRRRASTFDIPDGLGFVLSDRTGDVQAFRHQGDLTNEKLEGYLRKYADPNRVVKTTESNVTQQVSYYDAAQSRVPASSPAPVYSPAFSGGGRSC